MQKQLKSPLTQTAIIIGAVILLIGSLGVASGVTGGLGSIAQFILFIIGLGIGLLITICVLVGIFFASAAMADKKQAGIMWNDFKKAF